MAKSTFWDEVEYHHGSRTDALRASYIEKDALVGAGLKLPAYGLLLEIRRLLRDVLPSTAAKKSGGAAYMFSAKRLALLTGLDRKTVGRYLSELEELGAVEMLSVGHGGTELWVRTEREVLQRLRENREVQKHLAKLYAGEMPSDTAFAGVPTSDEIWQMIGVQRQRLHGDGQPRLSKEPDAQPALETPSGMLSFLNERIRSELNTSALSGRYNRKHMKQLLDQKGPVAVHNLVLILTGDWPTYRDKLGATASKPTPNVLLSFWDDIVSKILRGNEDCLGHVYFDGVAPDYDAPVGHKIPPKFGRDSTGSYREKTFQPTREQRESDSFDSFFENTDGYDVVTVGSERKFNSDLDFDW